MAISAKASKKPPRAFEGAAATQFLVESAHADLRQDALSGQELSAEADDETHHGKASIPGLSEVDETEASVVRH